LILFIIYVNIIIERKEKAKELSSFLLIFILFFHKSAEMLYEGDKKMKTMVKIYMLYSIDTYGRPKFCGRYASKHRADAAAMGLGLTNYFLETEAKEDEYGGYVNINAALKSKVAN
jgi:hypothetical protein